MTAHKEPCHTTATLLTRHWWLLALRGLAALIFGAVGIAWPGITLPTLLILFGVFAVVNGVLSFILAAKTSHHFPRFSGLILPGLVSIAVGVLALLEPI